MKHGREVAARAVCGAGDCRLWRYAAAVAVAGQLVPTRAVVPAIERAAVLDGVNQIVGRRPWCVARSEIHFVLARPGAKNFRQNLQLYRRAKNIRTIWGKKVTKYCVVDFSISLAVCVVYLGLSASSFAEENCMKPPCRYIGQCIPNGSGWTTPKRADHNDDTDYCCIPGSECEREALAKNQAPASPEVYSNVTDTTGEDQYINIGNPTDKTITVTVVVTACRNILATCGTIAHNTRIAPRMIGHFLLDHKDPDQPWGYGYRWTAEVPGEGTQSGVGGGGGPGRRPGG